jgi:hypothetical protein
MPSKKTASAADKAAPQAPKADLGKSAAAGKTTAAIAHPDTPLSALKVSDLASIIGAHLSDALANFGGSIGRAGAHVNSGPTHHANVPGHANFADVGSRSGAHVNSGPTHHANVPGHANFSRTGDIFSRPGGVASGAHANSGPTHHANVPGHANFTMPAQDATVLPALSVTLESGIHVSIPQGGAKVLEIAGTKITRG